MTRIFLVPLILIARNSWNLFSPSVIANCFRRADFVTPSTHFEEVVESEDAEDRMMMQVTLFPLLLSIKLILVS